MKRILLFSVALFCGRLVAAVPAAPRPAAELGATDAIVLGAIEGVTEYLPISSTGHLIVASTLLQLEDEKPLVDAAGQPLWATPPAAERKEGMLGGLKRSLLGLFGWEPAEKDPAGVPLTLKLAADSYNIIIQFGAIAAVAVLYWSRFTGMLRGLIGRDQAGLRLLGNLIVAFLPAAVFGLLVHDWIYAHLFSVPAVIAAQVAGAALMFWAERRRRRQASIARAPAGLDRMNAVQAARIGVLQCVAMWPGTSRSMMTIVGGYFEGLDPRQSAEFSFLLGFVTLSAATVFKCLKSGGAMIAVFGWAHVLLGCAVAAVVAIACVRFLVSWLTRHGLMLFVWYRLALALLLGVLLATGFLH